MLKLVRMRPVLHPELHGFLSSPLSRGQQPTEHGFHQFHRNLLCTPREVQGREALNSFLVIALSCGPAELCLEHAVVTPVLALGLYREVSAGVLPAR